MLCFLTNAKTKKIRIAYELKPEQITALCAFILTNDIACFLPTGFGKMFHFLIDDLSFGCVFVIFFLNVILND